ncbi:MAG: GTP-binding protein [Candidatus Sericytochromatia bacterium]
MKYLSLTTIGHINHGKTTLIKYLTGIDTDTRKDEQERGMTIDAGFAFLEKNNTLVSFIDVPGHEKFAKNMLSVISEANYFLLCISAKEGIMPQTEEHLDIVRILNIKEGLVIITKIDLVPIEEIKLLKNKIKYFLNNKGFYTFKILDFSIKSDLNKIDSSYGVLNPARSGDGGVVPKLPSTLGLKSEIFNENKILNSIINLKEIKNTNQKNSIIFPIDRVFIKKGLGKIITGNLYSGKIQKEMILKVFPYNKEIKIKNIEFHKKNVAEILSGYRVGLNINENNNEIKKGDILVSDYNEINIIYVNIIFSDYFNKANLNIKKTINVRFYHYSSENFGSLSFLDEEKKYAKIKFEKPIFIEKNTKFIIKTFASINLIGGGIVLKINEFDIKTNNINKISLLSLYEKNDFFNIVNYYFNNFKKII